MKKRLLFIFAALLLSANAFAVKIVIYNISNAYSQPYVQINLGDTIEFATTLTHTTQEVSMATWLANDTTHLPGGFDGPAGGGIWVPTTLGEHYYVCVEHVQMDQMKGIVKVSQLGVEDNKSVTMQVFQSVSEQYLKLVVGGGSIGQ